MCIRDRSRPVKKITHFSPIASDKVTLSPVENKVEEDSEEKQIFSPRKSMATTGTESISHRIRRKLPVQEPQSTSVREARILSVNADIANSFFEYYLQCQTSEKPSMNILNVMRAVSYTHLTLPTIYSV
eukprot:TRINITY_DN14140_c0_g1_i1.p1 TRINITY_DN14140_c0_g1~~TRINITY_DN14140_c0_g1_i1.p1  ORF type:complete len:149 (-),score=28.72 TRINITY_DN14140_c0_g1_i1:33-419(-)